MTIIRSLDVQDCERSNTFELFVQFGAPEGDGDGDETVVEFAAGR